MALGMILPAPALSRPVPSGLRPHVRYPVPKRKEQKKPMTVCIAAICQQQHGEPRIVLCADTRLDYYAGTNEGNLKIGKLAHGWVAMLSGMDWTAAKEIHGLVKKQITRRAPKSKIGLHDLLARAAKSYLSGPFNAKVQIDILVCGFIGLEPLIAKLSVGDFPEPSITFSATYQSVGSGSTIAEVFLNIRNCKPNESLGRTLYCVYEAKKYSEKNSGVGPDTVLLVLFPPTSAAGAHQDAAVSVSPLAMSQLESTFSSVGLKPTPLFPDAGTSANLF